MLKIPPNDILIIGLSITVLGGFIFAFNYFGIDVERASLEGRLQFGGSSFDMKNKIIAKYHAIIGFSLIAIGFITNLVYILVLQKHTTFNDLRGRSIFFGSWWNALATIAVLFIILRSSIFLTSYLSRRRYFPFLQKREINNFQNNVKRLNNNKEETVDEAKRGIDQLLLLFDIKVRKNYTYDMKIKELKDKVFTMEQ